MGTGSMKRVPHPVVGRLAAAALVAASLVAIGAGSADGAATVCQRTVTDSVPQPIQDTGAFVNRTIDDPESGLVVTDVNVSVDLHYPAPADLAFEFKSWPSDESFILSTFLYQGEQRFAGANMLGTVFDDEASAPISWRDSADPGRFLPTRRLSDVEGLAGATYELLLANIGNSGTGTLDSWAITLTYAQCDFDKDGVEDHADRCPGVKAATASGCPVAARSLTATYRLGSFKGALSSNVTSCRAGRAVTVWKVRSGPDRLVGTTAARSDGSYRLTRAKRTGRYYATSARLVVTGVAECPAVRSATFRIR